MAAERAERVAVIGGGMMGVGVAQVFAAAGHEVALQDVYQEALERAPARSAANLTFLAEHGLFAADGVEDAVGRVRTTTDLAEPPRAPTWSWSACSRTSPSSRASSSGSTPPARRRPSCAPTPR